MYTASFLLDARRFGDFRLGDARFFGEDRLRIGDLRLGEARLFGEDRLRMGDLRLGDARLFGEDRLSTGDLRLGDARLFGEDRLRIGDFLREGLLCFLVGLDLLRRGDLRLLIGDFLRLGERDRDEDLVEERLRADRRRLAGDLDRRRATILPGELLRLAGLFFLGLREEDRRPPSCAEVSLPHFLNSSAHVFPLLPEAWSFWYFLRLLVINLI